jgi:hypothetical protein
VREGGWAKLEGLGESLWVNGGRTSDKVTFWFGGGHFGEGSNVSLMMIWVWKG